LTSFEEKLAISSFALANHENFKNIDLNPLYPNTWNSVARAIQLLIYIIGSLVLIRVLKPRFIHLTGQLKYQYNYTVIRLKVLLFLIFMIAAIQNVVNLMYYNQSLIVNYAETVYFLLNLVMFIYFAVPLFVLLCPKMLYGLPYLETKHVSAYQFDDHKKNKVR
jgi:hypothetical protein